MNNPPLNIYLSFYKFYTFKKQGCTSSREGSDSSFKSLNINLTSNPFYISTFMMNSASGKELRALKYHKSSVGRKIQKLKSSSKKAKPQQRAKNDELAKALKRSLSKFISESGQSTLRQCDFAHPDFHLDPSLFRKLTSAYTDLSDDTQRYIGIVEDILLHMYTISQVSTFSGRFTTLLMLVKKLVSSDQLLVVEIWKALFSLPDSDSLGINPNNFQLESFMSDWWYSDKELVSESSYIPSSLSEGISIIRDSDLLSKIGKLISILLAAGLCGVNKKLNFDVHGLRIFSFQAAKHTGSCMFDLIEMSIKVVSLFIDKGYLCFTNRSLWPLFMSNDGGTAYYIAYANMIARGDDYVAGIQRDPTIWFDTSAFERDLLRLVEHTRRMIAQSDPTQKRIFTENLRKLIVLQHDWEREAVQPALRPAPFGILVSGPSSCGKSTIVNLLACAGLKFIMHRKKIPDFVVDGRMICTLNELDAYHTDYTVETLWVILDDIANPHPDHAEVNPAKTITDFLNNIPRKAVKAELNEKGKIAICPYGVAGTTNNPRRWMEVYSVASESIARRFDLHIHAVINPEWVKPGASPDGDRPDSEYSSLDVKRLAANQEAGVLYPDAWLFDIWTCTPSNVPAIAITSGVSNSTTGFQMPTWHCKFRNLHMKELLNLYKEMILAHQTIQESVVKSNIGALQRPLCIHGDIPGAQCELCCHHGLLISDPISCSDCLANPVLFGIDEVIAKVQKSSPNESWMNKVAGDYDTGGPEDEDSGESYPRIMTIQESIKHCSTMPPLALSSEASVAPIVQNTSHLAHYLEISKLRASQSRELAHKAFSWTTNYLKSSPFEFDEVSFNQSYALLSKFSVVVTAMSFFPERCFQYVDAYLAKHAHYYRQLRNGVWISNFLYRSLIVWIVSAFLSLRGRWYSVFFAWFTFWSLSKVLFVLLCVLRVTYNDVASDRHTIARFVRGHAFLSAHRKKFNLCVGTISLFTLLLGAYRVYQSFNKKKPHSEALIVNTHSATIPDQYLKVENVPLPECASDDSTYNYVRSSVRKHLYKIEYLKLNGAYVNSNAFCPCSGYLIVPRHELKNRKSIVISVFKDSKLNVAGGAIVGRTITSDDWVDLGSSPTDLALLRLDGVGPQRNLVGFFPKTHIKSQISTVMFWISPDCTFCERKSTIHAFDTVDTKQGNSFKNALWYTWKEPSASGMCIGVHVVDHPSKSSIAGFHLAGVQTAGGTNCAQCVTNGDLYAALDYFGASPEVFPFISESTGIDTQLIGNMRCGVPVHKEHRLTHLGYFDKSLRSAQVSYYGSLENNTTRPNTGVTSSPISSLMTEIFGIEQLWGPPANCRIENRIRKYEPYRKYLDGVSQANQRFPTRVMKLAVGDYRQQISRLLSNDDVRNYASKISPFDELATVNGVPNLKFADKVDPKTSAGFPWNEPKERHMEDADPSKHDTYALYADNNFIPQVFSSEIMKLVAYNEDLYDRGFCARPIMRVATKDEPTLLVKNGVPNDKVRALTCAPIHLSYSIRKYFLPVAAFISRYPVEFECAVGINAQGPQWDILIKHIVSFGQDRMVAGDFKKYDQHMSAMTINVVLNIMIWLADTYMDYTVKDLRIMRSMTTDISYPLILIDNDLIQLFGSNPTGHNMTAYVNSLVNSIYQRCIYFSIYPDKTPFNKYVKLITYGDDNAMGVSPDVGHYNHVLMSALYAKQGIVYTMADKDAKSVPYIHIRDLDFLKHNSRFVERFGMWISTLAEMSIYKSLMSNVKSQALNPDEVSIQCLQTALHEWSFYDRAYFNDKQQKVLELIHRAFHNKINENTTPSIDVFTRSYDQREQDWMVQYGVNYVDGYNPLVSEASDEYSLSLTWAEDDTDDEDKVWDPFDDMELYRNMITAYYGGRAYLTYSIIQYLKMFIYIGPSIKCDDVRRIMKFPGLTSPWGQGVNYYAHDDGIEFGAIAQFDAENTITTAIIVESTNYRGLPLPFQYFLYIALCLSASPIHPDLHWTILNMLSVFDLPTQFSLQDDLHFIHGGLKEVHQANGIRGPDTWVSSAPVKAVEYEEWCGPDTWVLSPSAKNVEQEEWFTWSGLDPDFYLLG